MKILLNHTINNYINTPQRRLSFKGFDCSEHDFEIKTLYNLPCPACGIPMLQRNQIDNFVNSVQNKTGNGLVEVFKKYYKYFHETEAKVADILIIEAQKNPTKNLSELAQEYLNRKLERITQEQSDVLDRIKKYSYETSAKNRAAVAEIVERYENHINLKEPFDKAELIKELNQQINENSSAKKRIQKAAHRMPDVEEEEIKFLIKYAQKTQAELASRFVTPSFITCEHIRPKSKDGQNNTANYLAECESCNSKRNNALLSQWINNFAIFKKNFAAYVEAVGAKIKSGEVSSKYQDYLKDITATVSTETQGKIDVTPPKLQDESSAEENETDTEKRIAQIKKTLESQMQSLKEAKELQQRMDVDEQFGSILQYLSLKNRREALEDQRKEQRNEINDMASFLNRYYKKIEEMNKKKAQLIKLDSASKEANELRGQIRKIKNFVDSKNSITLEENLAQAKARFSATCEQLAQVNEAIQQLEEKIDFPDNYTKQIEALKVQIGIVETILGQIRQIETEINACSDVNAKIAETEAQIRSLLDENSSIDLSQNNGADIEQYRNMQSVIKRAEAVKNDTAKSDNKFVGTDSLVYELARQKALEIIEFLAKTSNPVRHQINLDKVSCLAIQLNDLHLKAGKKRANESKREHLFSQLDQYPTKDEIESEIRILTQEYKKARERFDAATIDVKIKNLESEIAEKQRLLSELESAAN